MEVLTYKSFSGQRDLVDRVTQSATQRIQRKTTKYRKREVREGGMCV